MNRTRNILNEAKKRARIVDQNQPSSKDVLAQHLKAFLKARSKTMALYTTPLFLRDVDL